MEIWQRFKIGVFGSAGGSEPETLKQQAWIIGGEIAKRGGILCTGACPGIPHVAALEARVNEGIIHGFSPAMNIKEHVEKYGFPTEPYILIFTGMEKKGRNIINTRTCDAGILISGRTGTWNEFTLLYDEGEGKAIGLLAGSGGAVDNHIIPFLKDTEKQSKAKIIIEKDPKLLVDGVFKAIEELRS